MAVGGKLRAIYNAIFEAPEAFIANRISDLTEWRKLQRHLDRAKPLTKEQVRQIREFWKPYCHVSTKWCQYYCAQNGIFDPRYIPNTLYFSKIDQHFNARKLGWGFNDKNYYARIFHDIPQPEVPVHKIGRLLFDESYRMISADAAMERICAQKEVLVKPARDTGSGRGIRFLDTVKDRDALRALLESPREQDLLVQRVVRQHPALAAIYPGALNTVRVTTLLLEDGVHVLSGVLRMGAGGSRVDNASSGGISAGIGPDGTLKPEGHILYAGTPVRQHPDGFVLEGFRVPQYEKILETARRAAQVTGNFRLVSWDLAVDENGTVLLIEANMRKGGIAIHQFNNGPLFGDLTDRVLQEVFGKG